jgi:hypothetical protein
MILHKVSTSEQYLNSHDNTPNLHDHEQGEKQPKRTFVSFFSKGQTSSVHPSDVETGRGYERRSRFRLSHAPQQRKESMVGTVCRRGCDIVVAKC